MASPGPRTAGTLGLARPARIDNGDSTMSIGKRHLFAALASLVLVSSLAGPAAAQGVEGGAGRPVPLMTDPNPSTHRVRPSAKAAFRAELGMPSATATINVNFMSSGTMFGNACSAWSGPAQQVSPSQKKGVPSAWTR